MPANTPLPHTPNDNYSPDEFDMDIAELLIHGKIKAAIYNGDIRFYHADHPLPPNAIPIDPVQLARSISPKLFADR